MDETGQNNLAVAQTFNQVYKWWCVGGGGGGGGGGGYEAGGRGGKEFN